MPNIQVDLAFTPEAGGENRQESVTTDAVGRFRFAGFPPGRYSLTAMHPDQLAARFRATRSGVLAEDIPASNLTLRFPRLVRVFGTVRNREGEPLEGILVTPVEARWSSGRLRLEHSLEFLPGGYPVSIGFPQGDGFERMPAGQVRSGPDGRYGFLVTAGSYYLELRSIQGDDRRWSDEEFTAWLDSRTGLETPARLYYPGVTTPERAIQLNLERDIEGLDIVFDPGETGQIQFRFSVPEALPGLPVSLADRYRDGDPVVKVTIRALGDGLIEADTYSLDDHEVETIGEDSYALPPLPVGQYELDFSYPSRLLAVLRGYERIDLDPIARRRVTLRSGTLELGEIVPTTNTAVSGRVVFASDTLESPTFEGRPGVLTTDVDFGGQRFAEVSDDGTFALAGLPPGLHSLSYTGTPDGWYVASITSGSRDVLRHGLQVGGAVAPVEITLRNDSGRVEGTVLDDDRIPQADAFVVLIPPSDQRGAFTPYPTALTDSRGRFRIEAPPGPYRLLAVERTTWSIGREGPAFLNRYELRADPITVDPSSATIVETEIAPLLN